MRQKWTVDRIAEAIGQSPIAAEHAITVERVFEGNDVMLVSMGSHGDLGVFVAASDDEIQLSTRIAPVADVPNVDAFNARILRMGRLLPLSSFSIGTYDGGEEYELINEMPSDAGIEAILDEMIVLAENSIEAAEAVAAWKSEHAAQGGR